MYHDMRKTTALTEQRLVEKKREVYCTYAPSVAECIPVINPKTRTSNQILARSA